MWETQYQKIIKIFESYIGKRVAENSKLGYQCVAWVKQFAQEMRSPIGTFWWSAYSGWSTCRPFRNTKWKRIDYKKWLVPTAWDIIFFWPTQSNPYGHVAICDGGSTPDLLKIVEQNAWSGNGDGKWENAIKRSSLPYDKRGKCLGWYTIQ